MRVSHSETSKLKIPQILKIFWPAWEPCREATSEYSDSIFPVRILRILTYQPCKYEGMGMHSVDTLVCRTWGKYRWIMEIARQNVLFWRGSIKRLDLQMTYRYRAEPFRVYSYMVVLHSAAIILTICGSDSGGWKFLKFKKYFDLRRRPVERQPVCIVTISCAYPTHTYLPTL